MMQILMYYSLRHIYPNIHTHTLTLIKKEIRTFDIQLAINNIYSQKE